MLAQQLINGLMLGASYALVAIGYTIIFGVLRLLHFAHGEVFMFGAFIGLQIVLAWSGVNIYLAIIFAMLGTGVIGVIVALIAVRPISSKYPLAPLISSIGATLIMQNVAVSVFGGENQSFPETMDPVIYGFAGVTVSNIQIFTLLMSMIIMVALWQFVGRSKTGRAIRAVAESHETAALMGVNVGRTVLITFFLASCLAGAAGVLDGVKNSAVSPFMGLEVAVAGLVCMLLGGLGNIFGAMVAGFILGLVEILSAAYLGTSLRDLFTFVILILILLYKPSGLFGTRVVDD